MSMPDEPRDDNLDPAEKDLEKRLRDLLGDDDPDDLSTDPNLRFATKDPDEIELTLRDFDQKTSSTKASEFPEPPSDEEINERIERLRDKVSEAGSRKMPEVPDWNYERPKAYQPQPHDKHNYRGLGVGITVAYALVGFMVLGFGVGWLIDRATGINWGQPVGALVGTMIGIGVAFWLMNRDQ